MDLSNLSSNLPFVESLEQVSLAELNKDLTNEFKNTAKAVASLYNSAPAPEDRESGMKAKFSEAAKAVASLYRTGTNSNVLLTHKGYLDCLDDLLQILTSGEDMENWVLTKRAELTNLYNCNSLRSEKEHKAEKAEATLEASTCGAGLRVQPATRDAGPGIPEAMHEGIKGGKGAQTRSVPVDYESGEMSRAAAVDAVDGWPQLSEEHEFALPAELMTHLVFRPSFPALSVSYKKGKRRAEGKKKMVLGVASGSGSDCESDEAETEVSRKRRSHGIGDPSKRRRRGPGSENDGQY